MASLWELVRSSGVEGRGYRSLGLSVAAEVSTVRTMGWGERKDGGLGGAGGMPAFVKAWWPAFLRLASFA